MKSILLTITLTIIASAFAHNHNLAFRSNHSKVPDSFLNNQTHFIFSKGFLDGVAMSSLFNNIKDCISQNEAFHKQISTGIARIKTKDSIKAKGGLILLGKVVQIISTAAKDCMTAEKDIIKLLKLIQVFDNPKSFLFRSGKSLLINNVEVIYEVTKFIEAYDHTDFYNLGYWIGKTMETILLGLNQPLRPGFIDFLNKNQNSWTAKIPNKFSNMTLAQIKARYLGHFTPDYFQYYNLTISNNEEQNEDIPEDFDSRDQWYDCIHPIRDQGECVSGWAFASSGVLSDRFCIASDQSINVVLSPQYQISCDNYNLGCKVGNPLLSWWFLSSTGLPSDSCFPYNSSNGTSPKCTELKKCADGTPIKYYKAKRSTIVQPSLPTAIQTNILKYGPVEATLSVYEDFMSYEDGIYKHTSGPLLGVHSVKIIGWGKEDETSYWIGANSWGTEWGMEGYFKIAFGECSVERGVVAAQPDVTATRQSSLGWFH